MTRDAQAVRALLASLTAWMPGPATVRSNPLSYREDSGEAPSTRVACDTCQGRGTWGKLRATCKRCDGRGMLVVDGYTRREVSTSEQRVERRREVRCDACGGNGVHGNGKRCSWCEGTGSRQVSERSDAVLERLENQRQLREGVSAGDPFGIVDRKGRLYRQGSYAELDDALFLLGIHHPVLCRCVMRFVVYGEDVRLSDPTRALVDEACERLAQLMPKPIRVPTWARNETIPAKGYAANGHQRAQRNEQVRQLREQGLSLTKIGIRVGLTKQRVSQILSEEAA